jgi:hypothetical protein
MHRPESCTLAESTRIDEVMTSSSANTIGLAALNASPANTIDLEAHWKANNEEPVNIWLVRTIGNWFRKNKKPNEWGW